MVLLSLIFAFAQMRHGQHDHQQHQQHGHSQCRGHDNGLDAERVRRYADVFLVFRVLDPLAAHQKAVGVDAVGGASHQGDVVLALHRLQKIGLGGQDDGDLIDLIGQHPVQHRDGDRVVIIEDVTTAGTSIEETLPIIKAQGDVNPIGLVVSVDRMERGKGTKSALSEIEEKYGLKTTAIVTMAEVVEHLYNKEYKGKVIIDDKLKAAIDAYYEQYGVKE